MNIDFNDSAALLYPGTPSRIQLPYFEVPAGYPSAAQDYLEEQLNIHDYLIGSRKASIFLFRIGGWSMKEAGIMDGDIIIVDTSLSIEDGHIVVAEVQGAYTCKYFRKTRSGIWLEPANEAFRPIKVPEEGFNIFGRYDGLIRKGAERNHKAFHIPTIDN